MSEYLTREQKDGVGVGLGLCLGLAEAAKLRAEEDGGALADICGRLLEELAELRSVLCPPPMPPRPEPRS